MHSMTEIELLGMANLGKKGKLMMWSKHWDLFGPIQTKEGKKTKTT